MRAHPGHADDSLGISRKNLWEKMKKLGLSVNEAAS
jgi:DNA-binding NtrC family response regulator